MLITKTANVKWASSNRKWYESFGYKFTKNGDEFQIYIRELTKSSDIRVDFYCDYCLEEGIETIVTSSWKSYCKKKSEKDNCINHIVAKQNEMGVRYITPIKNIFTKVEIITKYKELSAELNGKIPTHSDINAKAKIESTFPNTYEISREYKYILELREACNIKESVIHNSKYSKEELILLLQAYINKYGYPLSKRNSFKSKFDMPSYESYVSVFGDNLVDIITQCGYSLTEDEIYNINSRGIASNKTKEEVIEIIVNMQSKLSRPLMYDDFRNPNKNEVGITSIKKFWGSMNKMKKELGLKVIQESMIDKIRTFNELKEDITRLCNKIYTEENRKIITYKDIDNDKSLLSSHTYYGVFKINNNTIRDFIKSLGFELLEGGRGLIHIFEDGEKTKSSYEYEFSKYLKEKINLEYNIDYIRDIRYREFISDYNGLLDCDYIINYQGRKIYIEVTGLLRDYEEYYYENKVINSNSKEKYRHHLMDKEKMFKDSGLEYYLLFPKNRNTKISMDFDFIDKIFNV